MANLCCWTEDFRWQDIIWEKNRPSKQNDWGLQVENSWNEEKIRKVLKINWLAEIKSNKNIKTNKVIMFWKMTK